MVNAKHRGKREEDPEFMPFPKDERASSSADSDKEDKPNPLANKALVLQFVKSPLAVNPGMVSLAINFLFLSTSNRVMFLNRASKSTSTCKARIAST